jgi:hypothetical protein
MPKPVNYKLNNRLVTFLPPAELKKFRERAYSENLCAAELLRRMVRHCLGHKIPGRRFKV